MEAQKLEELQLTEQEINLILTRRQLMERRQAQPIPEPSKAVTANPQPSEGVSRPGGFAKCSTNPKNAQEIAQKKEALAKDPKYFDKNRPKGWDVHCNPCQVHKGRLTPGHPMFWFEDNVFKNITNDRHGEEHAKIKRLLEIPVQTNSRDRVYHALSHLDVLWTEGNLPVSYKAKYEEFKTKEGIGDDNVHPAHKKKGVVYPVAKNKRPWSLEEYKDKINLDEQFVGDKGKGKSVNQLIKEGVL